MKGMVQRLIILFALVVTLAVWVAPVEGAPPLSEPIIHIVKWGENLSTIAAHYGTTVEAIVQANGISDPNRIYAGQRLVIPGATSDTVPSAGCTSSAA